LIRVRQLSPFRGQPTDLLEEIRMSNRVVSMIVAGVGAAAVASVSPHVASARAMTPPQKSTLVLKTGLWDECCGVSGMGLHGLTWTLFQTPLRGWADGQAIGLLAELGPIDPGSGDLRGGWSPVDAPAPMVTGWTQSIGLRVAIRW
jgi:hypothetical protein